MAGEADKVEGKIKEAGGDLTGDDDLKASGQKDQLAGGIKDAGENVKDKIGDLGDKIKD